MSLRYAPLCLLVYPVPVAAQPVPPADDIIVTALPPPPAAAAFGTVTVGGDALAATASGRIEEALARIPGLQQFRRSDSRSANPSAQGLNLRGLGGNAASRTLLLLDGVPQADAFFGYVPFTRFDADALTAARVTRGSGTGAFGAGAVAGTIELRSQPLAERPSVDASVARGSRGAFDSRAALVLPLGAGHVGLVWRHAAGDGFETTPASQRNAASVPARYRGDLIELSASAPLGSRAALDLRVAGYADDRTLRFAGADTTSNGIDASLRFTSRGPWAVEALGWVQARDFSNVVVSATSFRPTLNQRATPTTGWGGKIELRPPLGTDRLLRFGADVRGSDGVAVEDALAFSGARTLSRRAGGQQSIIGGYIEGDMRLGQLMLTAGGRLDHWRQTGGFFQEVRADGGVQTDTAFAGQSGTIPSARGAVQWSPTPKLTVRASAYTGFRIPTLNELYRGFTVFPVVTRANATLIPERLRGFEGGVDWTPLDGLTLGVTLFDDRMAEAVGNVTIASNLRERRNLAAIRARGVEAQVALSRGPWRFDAGWAHSDSRVEAGSDAAAAALGGLRPAQVPQDSGSATLAWVSGARRVQVGVRHIGAQYEDDRNIDRLPPATIIDALLRWPLVAGLTGEVRMENIADEVVITRYAAGSIDLGPPRSLWLGLRFVWR